MLPTVPDETFPDLARHLERTTRLQGGEAERVIAEVVAYFAETAQEFVRRRHRELQAAGLANPAIFTTVERELALRRFAAPALSHRQLRRLVYG